MDDRQFDKITKAIGSGTSRRTLLKRGGALFVGTLAGAVGVRSGASAQQEMCTCTQGVQTCTTVTMGSRTFTREVSGSQTCEVGNSDRQGTQQGTFSQECTQATQTTTTRQFRGCGNKKNQIGETTMRTVDVGDPVCVNTGFTPTGDCKNNPGPQKSRTGQ